MITMENIIIFKKLYHLPCLRKSSEVKVSLANLAIKHDIFFFTEWEKLYFVFCGTVQRSRKKIIRAFLTYILLVWSPWAFLIRRDRVPFVACDWTRAPSFAFEPPEPQRSSRWFEKYRDAGSDSAGKDIQSVCQTHLSPRLVYGPRIVLRRQFNR